MSQRNNTWFPLEPLGCLESFIPSHPPPLHRHVVISLVRVILSVELPCCGVQRRMLWGAMMGLSKVRLSILMEVQRDAGDTEQEGMCKEEGPQGC